MHFSDNLIRQIRNKQSVVCVGLDPRLDKIPSAIRKSAQEKYTDDVFKAAGEAIWQFNKGLIDAIFDICPIVKPQVAFYEMYGAPGMEAFAKTLQYAREKKLLTIADVKRNDIGTTAEAYANAYLGSMKVFDETVSAPFPADSVTVTPYLGWDGIKPFIDIARKNDKGLFILVKTSNKSSGDFQDLEVGGMGGGSLYETVGHFVESWGADEVGEEGYTCVGAVVGATYPEQAKKLRAVMPTSIFLVPGFGAQGGTVEDVKPCFNPGGMGAIINSSRDVIFAYENSDKFTEADYAAAARAKVLEMNEQLKVVFE